MNRDDIIRMAREAGCKPFEFGATIAHVEDLERFAELVASVEREACADLIKENWRYTADAEEMVYYILERGQA